MDTYRGGLAIWGKKCWKLSCQTGKKKRGSLKRRFLDVVKEDMQLADEAEEERTKLDSNIGFSVATPNGRRRNRQSRRRLACSQKVTPRRSKQP